MFLKHSSLNRYDLDSHGEAVPITALESIIAFDMDMSKGDIFGISASSPKVSLLLINRNTVYKETFHLHNDNYIEFVLSLSVTAENKPESPKSTGSPQPTRLSVRLCSVWLAGQKCLPVWHLHACSDCVSSAAFGGRMPLPTAWKNNKHCSWPSERVSVRRLWFYVLMVLKVRLFFFKSIYRLMFWLGDDCIQRSTMSGSKRRSVVEFDVDLPSSLILDQFSGSLYWIDFNRGVIESCDMNGDHR